MSLLLASIFLAIILLVNIVVPPEQEEIVMAVRVNIKQKMLAMPMARQRDSKS